MSNGTEGISLLQNLAALLGYSADQPLYFTRLFFWIFLALVIAGYSFFYRRPALRIVYLLVVSLYFYYKAGGLFFLILVFSTLVDYFIGRSIWRSQVQTRRRLLLILSVFINLLVLVYFKYAYFLTDVINSVTGLDLQVTNILALSWNALTGSSLNIHQIALPVGVSFFTFQTISYTVDVYRRKVAPVKNLADFGFYVSFFPQLVAGPIVRAASFVPQLYEPYHLSRREMWHAAYLILGGLIKKLLFADFLAVNLIDRVFENPQFFSGFENLMATYGYAIQIYFDFSGYTDIAIGVALLLGFRLPINFNSPYKAHSMKDFWRRWHISLSTWLRDYLYIPLGGNRYGEVWAGLFIMITMLLGGLWHGASWQFMLWGAYHGLLLVLGRLIAAAPALDRALSLLPRGLRVFFVFHLVWLGWVMFRTDTPEQMILMLSELANLFEPGMIIAWLRAYWLVAILMVLAFVLIWMPARWKEQFRGIFIGLPYWFKILIILSVLLLIREVQTTDLQPFIYFQF